MKLKKTKKKILAAVAKESGCTDGSRNSNRFLIHAFSLSL